MKARPMMNELDWRAVSGEIDEQGYALVRGFMTVGTAR
jgi:hypothetical protein